MISAQAIARSDEFRAKQLTAQIGRAAIGYITKGVAANARTTSAWVNQMKKPPKMI